jgi:Rrf2 family protein
MARTLGKPLVPLTALAEAERIPVHFLEQILFNLRQAGHLHSTRGKRGGYSLAEESSMMRVGDILRYLDGPLAPISCASITGYERCTCPNEALCGIRQIMIDAREALSGVFDGVTLQQLAERTLTRFKEANQHPPLLELLAANSRTQATEKDGDPEYLI